jgi:hypothetical protein
MRQNGKIQPRDHLLLERLWLRDHLLPSLSDEDHKALRENMGQANADLARRSRRLPALVA